MYLVLDNRMRGKAVVGMVFSGEIIKKNCLPSGDLLRCIDGLLVGRKIKLKDVKGIAAVGGINSFTAARLVVTLANSLSYALNIPVRSVPEDRAEDAEFIAALFKQKSVGRYISAEYSAEARVSFPRSR